MSATQFQLESISVNSVDGLLGVLDPILSPQTRGLCLSIYAEAGRTHEDALAARIRFKTEVLNCQRELERHSQYAEHRSALLDPALQLIDDSQFWEHQQGGLAYLATPERSLTLKTARCFPTISRLGGDLHLLPLLEAAATARRFHVLGLSEASVFLLRVSGLGEERLPGVPASFNEALLSVGFTEQRLEEKEFSNKNNRATEHTHQALRAIDEAVRKALGSTTSPLLLAAVDHVADDFTEVSQDGNLASVRLSGDPERLLRGQKLGDAAREAMHPIFRDKERQDSERAAAAISTHPSQTLTDLPRVVAAASHANLATVTISRDLHAEGSLESSSPAAANPELPLHLRCDLIDFVARRCLSDGGELIFVNAEDLPEDCPLIAQTRWEPVEE